MSIPRSKPHSEPSAPQRRKEAKRPRSGDAEAAARHSQGVVAPRAEPSRLGAKRKSGGRR